MIHVGEDTGICVQIGLENLTEYLYLATDDWHQIMKREVAELKRLPKPLHAFKNWQYIGVDCQMEWVQQAARTRNMERAHWVCAFVSGYRGLMLQSLHNHFTWTQVPSLDVRTFDDYYVPKITLSDLLSYLGVSRVDALAVDIEGHEVDVFKNYDWAIKPTYISVEFHDAVPYIDMKTTRSEFENIILSQGYTLLKAERTNIDKGKSLTLELQFLLKTEKRDHDKS